MASLAASAVLSYMLGFVVVLMWARALHRRHDVREWRTALPAAATGGALGGLCAILFAAAAGRF